MLPSQSFLRHASLLALVLASCSTKAPPPELEGSTGANGSDGSGGSRADESEGSGGSGTDGGKTSQLDGSTSVDASSTSAGSASSSSGPGIAPPSPDHRLLHCGGGSDAVVVLDLEAGDTYEPVWQWTAAEAEGIDPAAVDAFWTTPECKVVNDGTQIAISGANAVALVDYPSGDVVLHGPVAAAHSVELLPAQRLVGVGSTSALIRLFEVGRNEEVIWEDTMESAHGVHFDTDRELVYVIGHDLLRKYALEGWDSDEPALALVEEVALPDRGAHDLSPVPGTDLLVVTTRADVWAYDRVTNAFEHFDPLGDQRNVKSVDINPLTGRVAVSQGEESWWATKIQLFAPDAELALPDEGRLYKARWFDRD